MLSCITSKHLFSMPHMGRLAYAYGSVAGETTTREQTRNDKAFVKP